MACCGQIKIPKETRKIISTINNKQKKNTNIINNLATKSNRSPAGTLIKECPVCKCRSIALLCPVCGNRLN